MNIRTISIASAVVAMACLPALAQSGLPAMDASASAGEKAIATYLVADSVGDSQLGQLGLQKARTASVLAFARAMKADHARTAQQGLPIAQALGSEDVALKPESGNQVALSHLARYSGAKFEREYLKTLVEAHKNDISEIKDSLEFSTDPALRRHLAATLAVDTRHLKMALAAQKIVGTAK